MFGQNFKEDWRTNLKTKQKYQEVLHKRPNRHQKHSTRIDRPFEGALQHHHMEEVVEGMHHKHSLLEQCHKQRGSMVRVIKSPYLNTPHLLDVDRSTVHPLVRDLFHVKARQAPLAGRLKFYSENWKKLTQDVNILSIVQGFKISFSQTPFQFGPPQLARVNQEECLQINSEIKDMLRKDAIQQVKSKPGEFLSNLFLVSKKDGGHRPVINPKFRNSFIPYQHFRMEVMHLIKDLLLKHFLIKVDLKDAYFGITLDESSRKYIRFQWEGNLYEFLCLCFGLGPAPLIFTKFLKIPIALLRRINVTIIFLDMLVIAQILKEISQAKETLIFLLQNLGFVINFKKSQLPVKEIEFLGLVINSVNMTLALPQGKVLVASPKTTIMELTKLLGKLSFTA